MMVKMHSGDGGNPETSDEGANGKAWKLRIFPDLTLDVAESSVSGGEEKPEESGIIHC